MSENFAELFESSSFSKGLKPGAIMDGTIEEVNTASGYVVVNAGLKSEGRIPISQFCNREGELEVQVGDRVEVALDALENGSGQTCFSREKVKWLRAWEELERAYAEGDVISGCICNRIKGGFVVDLSGVRAFLPGSQLDVRPMRDASYLEGKPLSFKVVTLDRLKKNVVVSRRAALGENSENGRGQLEEGQVVKGWVKNLTDYGAFIDLGDYNIDGLLHVTDMSWRRVRTPSEVVSVGEEIQVKVLRNDVERNRVSLGLKQLCEDPWMDTVKRYPEKARFKGRVTSIAEYGCFVELEEGLEGLVHVSAMDWTNKTTHPSKMVQVGAEVEVEVLGVDAQRRRISLGMKQCKANPWEEYAAMHGKGEVIEGMIKAVTDFGIFVSLENSLDGLIHLSDLSWNPDNEYLQKNLAEYAQRRGETIQAQILAIDPQRERISLGIKQMQPDPVSEYLREHPKGSAVEGRVTKVEAQHVLVELAPDVTGLVKTQELPPPDEASGTPYEKPKLGDIVKAKVMGLERRKRMLMLSVKALLNEEQAEAVREYSRRSAPQEAKLGDLLREKLRDG